MFRNLSHVGKVRTRTNEIRILWRRDISIIHNRIDFSSYLYLCYSNFNFNTHMNHANANTLKPSLDT